jgi:hypothetical protein
LKYFTSIIIIFYLLILPIQLIGHGFGAHVLVRTTGGWWRIEQICRQVCDKEDTYITSYNIHTATNNSRRVQSVGESSSNCFIRIGFEQEPDNDIVCTPTQEFYLPVTKQWIPAYQLKVGDKLLSQNKVLKPITHIEFIKKSITVYSLEIEGTHTFLVGRHCILTHNIILPALTAGLSIPFGAGAAAGGTAGSFFGPATFAAGLIIGGLVGIVVKQFTTGAIPQYKLLFNTNEIEKQFIEHNNKNDDAQAPGKPTEKDGYNPPKKWDGKKVRNPNGPGYGWPDKKGRVWVPSGPNGHGGPHWDVQYPTKGRNYVNIVPGGKIRG